MRSPYISCLLGPLGWGLSVGCSCLASWLGLQRCLILHLKVTPETHACLHVSSFPRVESDLNKVVFVSRLTNVPTFIMLIFVFPSILHSSGLLPEDCHRGCPHHNALCTASAVNKTPVSMANPRAKWRASPNCKLAECGINFCYWLNGPIQSRSSWSWLLANV